MRKIKRAIMRAAAEKSGAKPSKALHAMWHRHQEKKYGFDLAHALREIGAGKGRNRQRMARRILPTLKGVTQ